MIPAELAQLQRETFARIDFARAYRLLRQIAHGNEAAIRERDVLRRNGCGDFFRARCALLDRGVSDPLRRPLWLRKAYRGRVA